LQDGLGRQSWRNNAGQNQNKDYGGRIFAHDFKSTKLLKSKGVYAIFISNGELTENYKSRR
jgi:hypothetical protein